MQTQDRLALAFVHIMNPSCPYVDVIRRKVISGQISEALIRGS
jgi:hypothetical protein